MLRCYPSAWAFFLSPLVSAKSRIRSSALCEVGRDTDDMQGVGARSAGMMGSKQVSVVEVTVKSSPLMTTDEGAVCRQASAPAYCSASLLWRAEGFVFALTMIGAEVSGRRLGLRVVRRGHIWSRGAGVAPPTHLCNSPCPCVLSHLTFHVTGLC